MDEFPFQRRLGAFPLRNERTEFRVWAPNPKTIALRLNGTDHRSSTPASASRGDRRRAARGRLRVRARRRRRARTPARAGSRRACAGRRGSSTRTRSSGRTAASARPALPTASSTSCTSARSRPEGTFAGAIPYLAALAELGVTAIELMPVAEFPGERGWGYDGVYQSATQSSYGGPLGLQKLVDAAHAARPGGDPRRRPQPRRRLRDEGAAGLRPVLHREAPHAVGRRAQRRRRAVRRRPRVGVPERGGLGARLPPRRPAPGRHPRDRRLEPRAPRGRDRPPRPRRAARARS